MLVLTTSLFVALRHELNIQNLFGDGLTNFETLHIVTYKVLLFNLRT